MELLRQHGPTSTVREDGEIYERIQWENRFTWLKRPPGKIIECNEKQSAKLENKFMVIERKEHKA